MTRQRTFSFADLSTADLFVDAIYEGGTHKDVRDDPIAPLVGGGNQGGTISSAMEKVALTTNEKPKRLARKEAALVDSLKRYSWTTLADLKGDKEVLSKIEEAEKMLNVLKKQLSQE